VATPVSIAAIERANGADWRVLVVARTSNLYRNAIEELARGSALTEPCIPQHWPGFEIVFRHRTTRYEILIENPEGVSRGVAYAELDGQPLPQGPTVIALVDDGETHRVRMILGDHALRAGLDSRRACERPVATRSRIWAWAARMPAASRVWLQTLDETNSAHTQCHPPPDSKATRKRSIKYSLRTMEPPRPRIATMVASYALQACGRGCTKRARASVRLRTEKARQTSSLLRGESQAVSRSAALFSQVTARD
jgi:hypothetical protein